MKNHHLLLALSSLVFANQASAYVPNTLEWPEERQPIPIHLHNNDAGDISVAQMEIIAQNAMEEWNRVPCSSIAVEYAGLTEDIVQPNENQVLEWIDEPERWGGMGTMTAGATIINAYRDPETREYQVLQVDIAFNAVNFQWVEGGASLREPEIVDPLAILVHEIGHFLGLGHTRADDPAATMVAAYIPDTNQKTLALDDKAGICSIYWVPEGECQSDDECREGEQCVDHTDAETGETVKLCAEQRGTYGDPCSGRDLNCEGLCLFTSTDFSTGRCSTFCETDDDCPRCYRCENIQTEENPFQVCREQRPCFDPEETDAGIPGDMPQDDTNDISEDENPDEPDAIDPAPDTPDLPPIDEDAPDPETNPDDPNNADTEPPASDKADDCSCTHVGNQRRSEETFGIMAMLIGFLALRSRKKRKQENQPPVHSKRHYVALWIAAGLVGLLIGYSTPQKALAQGGMDFGVEEIKLRTYVRLIEAPGIKKRDQRKVIKTIENAIKDNGEYELVSQKAAQRTLGRQKGRKFARCKEIDCLLQYTSDASIDRMLTVRLSRGSVYVVDLELFDGFSSESLKYDAATAESLRNTDFLAPHVAGLLRNDPPPPPVVEEVPAVVEIPVETIPQEDETFSVDRKWARWSLAAGGGFVVVGGILGFLADSTLATLQSQPHDTPVVEDLISTGESYQTSANVMLGLGITGLVTGTVLYFLSEGESNAPSVSRHRDQKQQDRIKVNVGPQGAGVTLFY